MTTEPTLSVHSTLSKVRQAVGTAQRELVLWQDDPLRYAQSGTTALAAIAEAIGVLGQLHSRLAAALNSTTT